MTTEREPMISKPTDRESKKISETICCKVREYSFVLGVCVLLLALETAIWRKYVEPLCGSYCKLNYEKEVKYFNYAANVQYDYSKMSDLQYPAGVIYVYKGLQQVLSRFTGGFEGVKEMVPFGIYLYFLLLTVYLMKRCRIPSSFMLFFVVPLGVLLQGQALMYILPEMLGMTVFLQFLAALMAGYQKFAMALLTVGMCMDSRIVFPLIPAILLCLMRTMGCRRAFLWISLSFAGFLGVSGGFILKNATAYFSRLMETSMNGSQWNPLLLLVHLIEQDFKVTILAREYYWSIDLVMILLKLVSLVVLINFRWLRGDGGIIGLTCKFMKSNRGHGIRPSPWTLRQTLTVIFESMLVSTMLRFPSLLKAEEFEVLTVMISGFYCVALAEPVPVPALFGLFAALSFPMTYLYRELEAQFLSPSSSFKIINPNLRESLHFLPLLFLPIMQLVILILFNRRDIQQKVSPAQSTVNVQNGLVTGSQHRRSASLSRRWQ